MVFYADYQESVDSDLIHHWQNGDRADPDNFNKTYKFLLENQSALKGQLESSFGDFGEFESAFNSIQ